MSEETIYVVDTFVPHPGKAKAFLDLYMEHYAPGARERGMKLEGVQVSPPMWLEKQSNRLTVTWSLKGAAAWWQMSFVGRTDPKVTDWWAEVDELVTERHRAFSASPEDVERLGNV